MANLLETWDLTQELQPFQAPDLAREDAARFGPNLTILAGQTVGRKTADGYLYPYSTPAVATTGTLAASTGVVVAGGSLAVGAYLSVYTAVFGTGESARSTESASVTTTTGNQSITWTWAAVPGATSYNFYRTAAGGASGSEKLLVSIPAMPGLTTYTYTDTGAIALGTMTPPSTNATAATDGTQTAVGFSRYSFVTDASGLARTGVSGAAGSPFPSTAGTRSPQFSTMPYFYQGTFNPNHLIGLDTAATNTLGGQVKANGAIAFF